MPAWKTDDASDIVLLILAANKRLGRERLSGITRLQKLAYLISIDPRYRRELDRGRVPDLDFKPYKMGPFTPDLYEAVETLSTFRPPLVETERTGMATDDLEMRGFIDDAEMDPADAAAQGEPRPVEYRLTSSGEKVATRLREVADPELVQAIDGVVREYGRLPLRELLRRVYRDHAEMTVRSEIRGQLGL